MRIPNRLNSSLLAAACAAITLHTTVLNADTPKTISLMVANAAVTATLTQVSGFNFSATASGVVQTSLLGTCVETVVLAVQFPATPDQPVLINGTGTFAALDGTNTLSFSVTGNATPDPLNPITEVIMFTSATTGTAVWRMTGFVSTPQ